MSRYLQMIVTTITETKSCADHGHHCTDFESRCRGMTWYLALGTRPGTST
jgi:hypothetical protein